ncbi:DNA cytosine methyltransferase [Rhodopseudomonas palustris]
MRRKETNAGLPGAQLVAIDLFSGGGALTLGLKTAGFRVVSAVEVEQHAFATYKANHPEVFAYKQDVRTVDGQSLSMHAPRRKIDLLAGCPPCQGFTSLTSKWRRQDPRNNLVREMSRLVQEIRPRAVMMENVPRLASTGRDLLDGFIVDLKKAGYRVAWDVLQVADYGTPQARKRLVLLAGRGFDIDLPPATHSSTSGFDLPPWKTVRDTIGGLPPPSDFVDVRHTMGNRVADWHVVRKLSPENQKRIKRAKPGASWQSIPEALRPNCHRGGYVGFGNVYGRMSWDEVSPTITAGCATFSKGRFGHPEAHRTISIREAALLQEIPDYYLIDTPHIDQACSIIGNALPCGFAAVMARHAAQTIQSHFLPRRQSN